MTGIMKELRIYAPKPPAFSDSTQAGSTVALPDTVESDSTYYSSRTLTPITSIDAVLISAASRDAVKIASCIMEYNIQTVLLGDSGWSDLSVPEDGKRFIEGSYLIAPFGTLSGGIGSLLIQGAALNDDRETVAMKGYDAAAVLLHCIRQGARDPEEIIRSLEATRDFRGASSVISFDPSHHANTAIAFVRIKDGIFQKVQRIKNTER
jgi:ABC-type branched-subunit amino acid transport system substrate-binding protein